MLPWFFVPAGALQQKKVPLPPDVIHHLRVLRLQKGDRVVLADGKGLAFRASVGHLETSGGEATIQGDALANDEPLLEVVLFPGITKGEKMEQVIRQSVELGVKKIVPVISERSIVRLSKQKKADRGKRWQKIARFAAGQCRRSLIPPVAQPLDFEGMLECWRKENLEAVIIPWEEEKGTRLQQALVSFPPGIRKVGLFTGPEGGISPGEIEQIRKFPRAYTVGLVPRILRAETAPLTVLSILMYHFAW